MYNIKKSQNCYTYKSVEQDYATPYRHSHTSDCKNCVYFSSRNCGMDVADSIEPSVDLLS